MQLDKSLPWQKAAEPQPDHSDLDIIWYTANQLYNYQKPTMRSEVALFECVAVNFDCGFEKNFTQEDYTSNELSHKLETTLNLTPYAASISKFLDVYYPYLRNDNPAYDFENFGYLLGCSCGPKSFPKDGVIAVCSTYPNPVSAGDGLVHEVWHQRLHALGIDFETHSRLLFSNADDELYESPIRKDKLRPMPAVIQAQYSYIGVTGYYTSLIDQLFDKQTAEITTKPIAQIHKADLNNWLLVSARNVYRIREGVDTISANLKPTPDIGERFFQGYMGYANRVIDQAIDQLKYFEQKFNVQYDWGTR
jgi:hypothetical protein